MKKAFLAISLAVVSTAGCAQLTPNEAIGGIIGGLAGSQIGGGEGRVAAAAAGAVLGANIGRQVPGPVYYSGGVPVIPTAPAGYPPGYTPPYVYGSPTYERPDGCSDREYIDGVYNPPAARAYCRGQVDREIQQQRRYESEAYSRGRRGLR